MVMPGNDLGWHTAAKDMLDVEDANGDAAAGEEDFMANLLASIGLKGAFSSTSV